jgi:hypothetical protein
LAPKSFRTLNFLLKSINNIFSCFSVISSNNNGRFNRNNIFTRSKDGGTLGSRSTGDNNWLRRSSNGSSNILSRNIHKGSSNRVISISHSSNRKRSKSMSKSMRKSISKKGSKFGGNRSSNILSRRPSKRNTISQNGISNSGSTIIFSGSTNSLNGTRSRFRREKGSKFGGNKSLSSILNLNLCLFNFFSIGFLIILLFDQSLLYLFFIESLLSLDLD